MVKINDSKDWIRQFLVPIAPETCNFPTGKLGELFPIWETMIQVLRNVEWAGNRRPVCYSSQNCVRRRLILGCETSSLNQSSTKPWNFTRFKKSLKTFVFRRDTNYSQSLMRLRAYLRHQVRWRLFQLPIQSNVNKRAQVFLFAHIFYNITFTYKLKHLRFQLTRNGNCKDHLDQASVCLDDFWKY